MQNFICLTGLFIGLFAATFPAQAQDSVQKIQFKAEPFELSDVHLLEGPFRDAMLRDRDYLLSLDQDRLLHMFRKVAGLPSSVESYGGWESPTRELRGHTMGHYLSACALMYASTHEERVKARAAALVTELAKCQQAMVSQGFNKGFLSAYPESFFDRVDNCKPVWAPYYTLHKIVAGLLDVHQLCDNQEALDVAVGIADWLKNRVQKLSHEQMQKSLGNEHGGINESFANLYALTRNPDHLWLAQQFNHEIIFAPLARGEDKLNGLHANTQIPKIIGAAREYELTGDVQMRDVAKNFWENVALRRSYCIGGHSEHEHFFAVEEFSKHLGPTTAETCNTYNMLKLTQHLFWWEPSAQTMDFYERALFNQILGSQDPRTGMMIYFASLKPGHFKIYNTPTDSFWCCTGTGMENHAKYADTIYAHSGRTLFVNLFIASELSWKEQGMSVRQVTKFPEDSATRLTFHTKQAKSLAVNLRWPAWAEEMHAAVNGKRVVINGKPGSYVAIDRQWNDGDCLEVRLPMKLTVEPLPNALSLGAILYGPIVLAGELGTEDLEKLDLFVQNQLEHVRVPAPEVPVLVCDAKDLLAHIQPVPGRPLAFRTVGIGRPHDVTLVPYWQVHRQRLNVYWSLLNEDGWKERLAAKAKEEADKKAFEARIVDEIQPGEQQPEIDHSMRGEKTGSGTAHDRKWRHAQNGGWFSYEMKVLPSHPMIVRCQYWGGDKGQRVFDVMVNDRAIATQELDGKHPMDFFWAEYPVPSELTQGKQTVTVKFQAQPRSTAGGVFSVMMMKR